MHKLKIKNKSDIDFTERKKKRVNLSISNKSIKLLEDNIPPYRRSAFIDFLILYYCEYEAANFNRYGFSKRAAEIISRNNQEVETSCDDLRLPELISELSGHLVQLKSDFDDQKKTLQQMKSDFEALTNGQ